MYIVHEKNERIVLYRRRKIPARIKKTNIMYNMCFDSIIPALFKGGRKVWFDLILK